MWNSIRLPVLVLLILGCSTRPVRSAGESSKRLKPKLAAAAARADAQPGPPNSVFLTALTRSAGPRPFTISRIFAQGEIPRYAQAVINGEAVETQCDVKTRWPDSSVQHAMVSFWADPHESSALEVSFVDQESGLGGDEMTAEEMLSDTYGFGAQMELTGPGEVLRADARTMLANGDFRYWLKGKVVSQVILEDRSETLKYDLGWDEFRSFHPIFVATFYRGWKGVRVEMIGENVWITKRQDLQFALALRTGDPLNPQPVYTKPIFTQFAGTRWRKDFWIGQEPPKAKVDLNFPYMIYTRAVPNYDLSFKVNESTIKAEYDVFQKTDKGDINGNAAWVKYFPTTGGRNDIGILPKVYVVYLYSFDPRLYDVITGYASVAAHPPIHLRESDPKKKYLKDSETPAFGRVYSLEARPTIWADRLYWQYTAPADKSVAVGPVSDKHGWTVDLAHQPSLSYVPYLVTGDWFHLEEIYFWAAHNLAASDPCTGGTFCRHDDWGFISPEMQNRGVAWGFRTLAHAAYLAPDDSPEKAYYTDKVYSNIAVREGMAGITDGAFYDSRPESRWSYGRRVQMGNRENPIRIIDLTNQYVALSEVDQAKVARVNMPWHINFLHAVMGHIEELGFPIGPYRRHVGVNLVNQLTHPDFNPFLAGSYTMPSLARDMQFLGSWKDVRDGYRPQLRDPVGWPQKDDSDLVHGYPHIARAAVSFLYDVFDEGRTGASAWQWLNENVSGVSRYSEDPKWAIVPRALTGSLAAAPARQASPRGRLVQAKEKRSR